MATTSTISRSTGGEHTHWSQELPASALRPHYTGVSAWLHEAVHHPYAALVMATLLAALAWTGRMCEHLAQECRTLKSANADFVEDVKRQAQGAFNEGDFRRAGFLLQQAGPNSSGDQGVQLLKARIFECTGDFKSAEAAYEKVAENPASTVETQHALLFCQRMATERNATMPPSRETLYRLHAEMMRRGCYAQARFIALDLKPDMAPLRASVEAMLEGNDCGAQVMKAEGDDDRVDVKVNTLTPATADLLRDLSIGRLSAPGSQTASVDNLAALDAHDLDLSFNKISDVSALRSMPLRKLNLSDCPVADLRPLAGLPLRELNLAHTDVYSIYPLALCPLEDLNLTGLPVKDLSPLRGMPLAYLDLTRTMVDDISALQSLPLKTLRLAGTPVRNIRPLAGAKLRLLDLSGTPVSDLTPLEGMPLVELDLTGCSQITDFRALESCQKLQILHLPKGARIPAALMHLPRLKLITH